MNTLHHVIITPSTISLDNLPVVIDACGGEMLSQVYRTKIGGYAKFFKMDTLCRLGFIASELLLQAEASERFVERDDRAVLLFNRYSSLCADRRYFATIRDKDNYFPGPAQFVYTLANIVTGEIAIRNKYYGETSFFVLPERNDEEIASIIMASASDPATHSAIAGWLDCSDDDHFEADLQLIEF